MKNQRGFVTLGIALMMLFLVSFNSFISVKGSILRQQSSNNAYYSEQSFHHAELGLNKVHDNINQYLNENHTAIQLSDIPTNQTTLNVPNVYSTVMNGNQLISTGYINGIALRKVTQILQITANSSGAAALSTLGYINLGGSTSASSAKAGGTISGNVPTLIDANSKEYQVALLDHNNQILKDTLGNIIYRSMTSDEYFMYYFGEICPIAQAAYTNGDISKAADCIAEAKISVAANPKGYICEENCSSKIEDDKIIDAYTQGKTIFWLANGGIDHKQSLGTLENPVIIFVMNIPDASQAAKINSNSTIFGILYVDVLDVQMTLNCSCNADSVITGLNVSTSYEDDLTKAIYTVTSTEGTKCSTNGGCIDSQGTIISKNSRYLTTYQQKASSSTTSPVYGGYTNVALNITSPTMCTINSCVQGLPSATSITCSGGHAIGDAGKCSFISVAVSGSNSIPLQIEITGTWESNGTGNSVIQGAVITSGNYQGVGNSAYIKDSTVIANTIFGGMSNGGFTTQPSTMSVSAWSDMN